jgi:hypothetical protein
LPVRRCMCACGPGKLLSRDALEPRARESLDEREERRVGDEGGGRECLTQAVEGQPVKEARVSGQRERERWQRSDKAICRCIWPNGTCGG